MEKELKWDAKMLSMFGQNGAVFGWALPQLHDAYPAKILTSDMAAGAGLARFKSLYPADFYDVGIAEQNLLGMTAGLCSEGHRCVAEAQACFLVIWVFLRFWLESIVVLLFLISVIPIMRWRIWP